MLAFFIHTLEAGLICLVGMLVYRISQLNKEYSRDCNESANTLLKRLVGSSAVQNDDYENKMNALSKAQSFAGIQLLDIKKNYGDLKDTNLEWLREAISLYLIGAIDLIGKEVKCSTAQRKELISLVLRSNLKLSQESSESYFQEALYRQLSSDNDLMVRAGAKAAKAWLQNNAIPNNMSLNHQLDDWGVFA